MDLFLLNKISNANQIIELLTTTSINKKMNILEKY